QPTALITVGSFTDYTGYTPCFRCRRYTYIETYMSNLVASSLLKSFGWMIASTTISDASRYRSISSWYSWRFSWMNCFFSSSSSIAAILLAYTAFIAASGPMTAIWAVGKAITASDSNAGPAIA